MTVSSKTATMRHPAEERSSRVRLRTRHSLASESSGRWAAIHQVNAPGAPRCMTAWGLGLLHVQQTQVAAHRHEQARTAA